MSQKPFVLSVRAVVRNDAGDCLVIRRSASSRHDPGLWEIPGGKSEPGETIEESILREVAEETGLQVELTRVVGSAESEIEDKRIAYLILEAWVIGGSFQLSGEHDAYRWLSRPRFAEADFAPYYRDFAAAYAQGADPDPRWEASPI
jgi:8-oxo-dGTP diphosphatase